MPSLRIPSRIKLMLRPKKPKPSIAANKPQLGHDVHWINKLPPEILGNIFLLVDRMENYSRSLSQQDHGIKDLAVQVCHYWREVAIGTPLLWTYLAISGPPPHPFAELCIARAGSVCPLDIEIKMKPQDIDDISNLEPVSYTRQALETLHAITRNGGTLDRWRNLVILTETPEDIFDVVEFINSAPTPFLQSLSLGCERTPGLRDEQEATSLSYVQKLDDVYSLSQSPQRPQLRRVDLSMLPAAFIFERASPFLSNLTRLKLVCATVLYPVHQISALLAASPGLEHLTLDTGGVRGSVGHVLTGSLQVSLPKLRFFALNSASAYDWGTYLLQVVDAPDLETFELHASTDMSYGNFDPATFAFLCIGRKNGVLLHNGTNGGTINPPTYTVAFPSLQHLDVKNVRHTKPSSILKLLQNYSMITRITVSLEVLMVLADNPGLLPNLVHLTYSGDKNARLSGEMNRVAQHRLEAGMKLPLVQIESAGGTPIKSWFHDTDGGDRAPLSALVGRLEIYDMEGRGGPKKRVLLKGL